jgi:hypothetical protein
MCRMVVHWGQRRNRRSLRVDMITEGLTCKLSANIPRFMDSVAVGALLKTYSVTFPKYFGSQHDVAKNTCVTSLTAEVKTSSTAERSVRLVCVCVCV